MIIRYKFADGTVSEVEVDDRLGKEIVAMDVAEANNDRRESGANLKAGWHIRLNNSAPDHEIFTNGRDMLTELIRAELVSERCIALKKAFATLEPLQRKLLDDVYIRNKKAKQIANEEGRSEAAVSQHLKRTREKLRLALADEGFTEYESADDDRCAMSTQLTVLNHNRGNRASSDDKHIGKKALFVNKL